VKAIWYAPVGEEHYEFLYTLLKERPKNASISHQKMPTWEEHCRFVDSWPTRYKQWHVVMLGHQMVGSAYLTNNNEYGMFVKKGFMGRGIAREAFHWIRRNHPHEKLYSNVNPHNSRIKKLLKSMGCKLIQETYIHPER
jgi:hypothetical protein